VVAETHRKPRAYLASTEREKHEELSGMPGEQE
jgi:hypothetical protein